MTDTTLINTLRRELRDCGQSWADVGRGAGIERSSVCRFAHGQQGLSLSAAARLADYLGIVPVQRYDWEQRERIWKAYRAGRLVPKPQHGE